MICLKNKKAKSSAVVSIEKEKKIREEELVGKWSECWLPPPQLNPVTMETPEGSRNDS